MKIVSYKNGNYLVLFNKIDGTKIRTTGESRFIPEFAESCDIKITNYCDLGCKFCYEGAGRDYKHPDLLGYKFLDTLHPYTEVAINGNDLSHPQLLKFLEKLKSRRVFTNITVNQTHFLIKEKFELIKELQERGLIHGIGISYHEYSEELITKVKSLKNTVLHVIAGILKEEDVKLLSGKGLKLLILGYKTIGRGISYQGIHKDSITKNIENLSKLMKDIIKGEHFELVSFDNLSLSQLNIKQHISEENWKSFYMGDDGEFTFYIDMEKGQFSKNSISKSRYEIGDKTIKEMFNFIKSIENVTG